MLLMLLRSLTSPLCQKLTISGNVDVEDLSPLSRLPELEELNIAHIEQIKDLTVFETGFPKLRVLDMCCLYVDDLSPLTRLQNLEELICSGIPNTTSLSPLARFHKLKMVTCSSDHASDVMKLKETRRSVRKRLYINFLW